MTLPPGGSDGSKLVCNYTVLLHHMALDVAGEPKVCLTHHVAALGCGVPTVCLCCHMAELGHGMCTLIPVL